jgi:Dyp-type peroxidase family
LAGFRKDHQELLCVSWRSSHGGRALLGRLAEIVASDEEVGRFNDLFREIRARHARDRRAEDAVQATWIGVGVSAAGLAALGVDVSTQLPAGTGRDAFRAGMDARREQTGDVAEPARWRAGIAGSHALIVIASDSGDRLRETSETLRTMLAACDCLVTFAETGATLQGLLRGHEHFGFKDCISQPVVAGYASAASDCGVALGEFLLGFPDEHGDVAPVGSLFRSASFLVFRRLEQDLYNFRTQVRSGARQVNVSADVFAAKMVGRWPSGSPLETSPDGDAGASGFANRFGYRAADDDGHVVPCWAHIRKANPRDASAPAGEAERHRMIRRGIPFTNVERSERGLHFLAIVADIARQFEYVQRTCLDDPIAADGSPAGPDPIAGRYPAGSPARYVPERGAPPVTVRLTNPIVRMTGGEYYAVLSIPALAELGRAGTVPRDSHPATGFLPDLVTTVGGT